MALLMVHNVRHRRAATSELAQPANGAAGIAVDLDTTDVESARIVSGSRSWMAEATQVYHSTIGGTLWGMPTTRPRHQITETPAVAHALDIAARRWPTEPRSKLLLRLVHAGSAVLEQGHNETTRLRQDAIDASSGKYADAFSSDYLAELRQDWPE